MKKGFFKSFTAMVLATAMTLGMNTFVFATTDDPMTVATTIKGVPLDSVGTAAATTYAGVTTKGVVSLTAAQAASDEGIVVAGLDLATDSYAVIRIPAASTATAAEGGFAAAVTAGQYTNAPLSNGDWLVFGIDLGVTTFAAAEKYNIIQVKVEEATNIGGALQGDSIIKNPVVRVVLPVNLNFAVDPLQFTQTATELADTNGQKNNQITANMFPVINKSNAPVMVSFDLLATTTTGVTLFDKSEIATNISKTDVSKTSKNIYLSLIGATTVTESSSKKVSDAKVESMAFDTTKTETVVPFDKTSKSAYLDFLLAATAPDTIDGSTMEIDDSGKGTAAFTVYAEMNAYADWKNSDIKIGGIYTLKPVSTDTVTALTVPAKTATDGVNQLKLATADRAAAFPVADVVIASNSSGEVTVARAATGYTAYLIGKPATITAYNNAVTGTVLAEGTQYTYDAATGIFTSLIVPSGDAAIFNIVTSGGTYKVYLFKAAS